MAHFGKDECCLYIGNFWSFEWKGAHHLQITVGCLKRVGFLHGGDRGRSGHVLEWPITLSNTQVLQRFVHTWKSLPFCLYILVVMLKIFSNILYTFCSFSRLCLANFVLPPGLLNADAILFIFSTNQIRHTNVDINAYEP